MDVSSDLFVRHRTWPLPVIETPPVDLYVGSARQSLPVVVPTNFSALTIVSRDERSVRPPDHYSKGLRAQAAYTIARMRQSIELGYYLDTRAFEPNNIAHLLLNIIPLCLMAREAVGDVTFVFRPLQPRFRELLDYFGIEPLCTSNPVTGKALTFHLSRGLSQYRAETVGDYPFTRFADNLYGDFIKDGQGAKKIFVSRKGERSLTNEAEVRAFLETRGYTTVYFEDHSIADQVAIMQAAEDIVAIHGAAMAYLVLTKGARSVIELLPPNVHHSLFPLAVTGVERFAQLISDFDDNVHFAGWSAILPYKQRAFSVDLGQLKRALDDG